MTRKVRIGLLLLGVLLILASLLSARLAPPVQAQGNDPDGSSAMAPSLQELSDPYGLSAQAEKLLYHSQTGLVRFLGTSPGEPIPQPSALPPDADSDTAARSFLAYYGGAFGLSNPQAELQTMLVEDADSGRSFVRFQQVYQGVPVMGGELIVQLDSQMDVLSASGETLPALELSTTPVVSPDEAAQTAMALVAKQYGLSSETLLVSKPELWVYNPILLGAPQIPADRLVWRTEVTTVDLRPVRELVLVDAQNGSPALNFNQIDTARFRKIYDNNNNPSIGLPGADPENPDRIEGGAASGISDIDRAYDYSGNTYNFYFSIHGRDSLNSLGSELISTVRYCEPGNCPFINAFWNGAQMVFGEGFAAADDVVGHELTHGLTQNESNLFYYMQSGAINESFSDIWGEFIDLQYDDIYDDDSVSARWLIGEDVPIDSPGFIAFRSMSDPPAFGDPDRMGSSNYACPFTNPYYSGDSGGVHTNSGVGNKAAFLMVDGGSFNGFNITGIGMTKTAKIFYETQTHLLTSASDYQDLAEALSQACNVLTGTSGITSEDCLNVRKAIAATEMARQPASCAANEAPVCDNFGFASEFNGDKTGWIETNGSWTASGSFVSTTGSPNSFTSLERETDLTDFTYTATMRRYGDCLSCSNGIVIRGTPQPLQSGNRWNTSYDFYYANNGLVAVVKRVGPIELYLLDWTLPGTVNTAPGTWNVLKVVAMGNTFYFYVNDKLVWLGHDNDYTSGKIGLIMYRDAASAGNDFQVDRAELKGGSPMLLLNEGFEYGLENWTHAAAVGSDEWYHDHAPSIPYYEYLFPYASSGDYRLYGYDQGAAGDYSVRLASAQAIPAGVNTYLRFRHAYDMEAVEIEEQAPYFFDGGVIEYSVNGGSNWLDAAPLVLENGYSGIIYNGTGNPLASRSAYVGDSNGYIATRLNLTGLAGNNFLFRFRMGADVSLDDLGWMIDEVQLYTCHERVESAYLPMALRLPELNSFDSQFTNTRSGWRPVSGLWTVNSGWYGTGGLQFGGASVTNFQEFADLDYSVSMLRTGCVWCANRLMIRGVPEPLSGTHWWNTAYMFQTTDDGFYSVWKVVNGIATMLQNWTASGAIVSGNYNVLRVVATGTGLTFYINGTPVWSGSDASLTKGRVGFGMYRDDYSTNNWLYVDYATLTGGTTILAEQQISPEQQALNEAANQNPVGDIDGSPER